MKRALSLVVREKTSLRGAHYRAQPVPELLSSWPLPRMISRSRSKMLHQETGVYSNQDTWTEVAEESEDLADTVARDNDGGSDGHNGCEQEIERGCHDDRGQWRKIWLGGYCNGLGRIRRLIVGKDLVDTQSDVGELVMRAFDGIALAAANSPNTEEESTGDSNADQDSIDITELRESAITSFTVHQKPSLSWKTGVDQRSSLSQPPMGRDDDPLRGSDGVDEGIAKSGAIGRGKS
ncbi:hypothetical protein KCU92_g139, partial [Aureobasidium melanogenum]